MSNLSFIWKAILKNGNIIHQFDNERNEHLFQEVKDNFNELKEFSIYNKEKNIVYIVDLINGLIYNNKNQKIDLIEEKKNNIRLIFFRRNIITTDFKTLSTKNHVIYYFLGLQWNDINGNNHKILLKIDKEGNFIIGI